MIRFGSKKEERLSSKGKVSVWNVKFSPQIYASTNFAKATKKQKKTAPKNRFQHCYKRNKNKTKQNKHLKRRGVGNGIFWQGTFTGRMAQNQIIPSLCRAHSNDLAGKKEKYMYVFKRFDNSCTIRDMEEGCFTKCATLTAPSIASRSLLSSIISRLSITWNKKSRTKGY